MPGFIARAVLTISSGLLLCLVPMMGATGCVAGDMRDSSVRGSADHQVAAMPPSTLQASEYDVAVLLYPSVNRLEGKAVLTLQPIEATSAGARRVVIALQKDLQISKLTGPAVTSWESCTARQSDEQADEQLYLVVFGTFEDRTTLTVYYDGILAQDVEAGEKVGRIHNFLVSSHVGPQGIYLTEGWFPRVEQPDQDEPTAPPLVDYRLEAACPADADFVLISSAELQSSADGRWTFKTPFPMDGLVLAGGPHVVQTRQVGDVQVETHLSETNAAFAEGLLDAMQYYLEVYQPLIGPYPYKRMVAVENFFSSGFAFPQFTLLGPAVIAMGQRGLRPGYLDHEMVHNWWGNGVLVDPADGNWCEALTSYCTNYYRYVLEGQPDQARKHRRDIVHHLSRMPPAKDLPLGDFGKEDGPSRTIGYSKGTMVFHMLAQQIGQEAFWQAMRQFRQGFLGQYANWADIQHVCEQASGQDLGVFFEQWVRRGGTPDLRIVSATMTDDEQGLLVVCGQSEPAYSLSVPIRLHYPGGRLDDVVVELQEPHEQVVLECQEVPEAVELDPDYQVYRRLSAEQIMPTISGLNAGDRLTIVMPSDDAEGYQIVVEQFTQEDKPDRIQVVPADELTEEAIATGNVLALGRAAWCPAVQALLTEADCPVEWMEVGFALNEQTYATPTDAILCCVRHPQDVGRVVAVYTSPDGSPPSNARLISFYGGNSIIVFQEGRPTVRVDLETPLLIPVEPPAAQGE